MSTEKKIIFLDSTNSFIVRSIVNYLEEMGYNCRVIKFSLGDVENNKNNFEDVVVAYVGSRDDVDTKALVYLRDICLENDHGLYLMGNETDLAELRIEYSISNVRDSFFRPINAKEVAERIGKIDDVSENSHKKHILVVDDSGAMLTTLQGWLGEKYRVSVVSSAMNAITFISKSIPDLILLDYEMPGCSGAQLLEMLRADVRTDHIPVIFLTGKDDPETVKKVLCLKPEGYLLKSMPQDYIVGQVDDFFKKADREVIIRERFNQNGEN